MADDEERVYRAEIIARPDPARTLLRATVEFLATGQEMAEEQAEAYAERLGRFDVAEVDSVIEIGRAR